MEEFPNGIWLISLGGDELIGRRVTVRGVYDPGPNDGERRWPREVILVKGQARSAFTRWKQPTSAWIGVST